MDAKNDKPDENPIPIKGFVSLAEAAGIITHEEAEAMGLTQDVPKQAMKVYEVRHDGHYLGGLSVVVAENEAQAIELTRSAILAHGLGTERILVSRRLKTDAPFCYVLSNGDY